MKEDEVEFLDAVLDERERKEVEKRKSEQEAIEDYKLQVKKQQVKPPPSVKRLPLLIRKKQVLVKPKGGLVAYSSSEEEFTCANET
jgi:hypothetical protein